jgi:prepilin-type N-terminal cleavage/methylation domain-containing protein
MIGAAREMSRRAFTLAEVLVAVMIIAVLSAVTIPTMKGRMQAAHAAALAEELTTLQSAIMAFKNNTGYYPGELYFLSFAPTLAQYPVGIGFGGGTYNSCGTNFNGTNNFLMWRGPYVSRNITGDYTVSDNFLVNNVLTRVPASSTPGTREYLEIDVDLVDKVTADILERQFDASYDLLNGTIKYTVGPNLTTGTLNYMILIAGC